MIKKNDNVIVITGGDKGKKGKVLKVLRDQDKLVVEGVNVKKRHSKSRTKGQPGQIIDVASPIHISNVKSTEAKKAKTVKAKKASKTETVKKS